MTATSVLLVDDRPDNLFALEAVLEPLGCDLVGAEHTGAIAGRLNAFALGLPEALMTTVVIALLEPATGRLPPALVTPAQGATWVEHNPRRRSRCWRRRATRSTR